MLHINPIVTIKKMTMKDTQKKMMELSTSIYSNPLPPYTQRESRDYGYSDAILSAKKKMQLLDCLEH